MPTIYNVDQFTYNGDIYKIYDNTGRYITSNSPVINSPTINNAVKITVAGDPTLNLQVATKQYVDNHSSGGSGGGTINDSFKTVRVTNAGSSTNIVASGEDTLKLTAGSNITLNVTNNVAGNKELVISSTASGGGSGGSLSIVNLGIQYTDEQSDAIGEMVFTTSGITSNDITTALGYTPYNASNPNNFTSNTGTVTSVRVQATSPVVSSVNTAQTGSLNTTISLADNYGDTKNPYASKTANYVLAAPNGSAGTPSFRKLVAADIPSLTVSKISDFPTIPTVPGAGSSATTVGTTNSGGSANTWSRSDHVHAHPSYTAHTAAAVKIGNDATGHVVLGSALVASDVGALSLTGGTVTGPVTFGDSVSIDDLSAGTLAVTGNATFTNNIQANTINGVTVGNSPKFTDTVTTVTTTGTGEVITSITASNGQITATKGNGGGTIKSVTGTAPITTSTNSSTGAVTITHNTSGVTAGTSGTSTATSGLSLEIPYVTYNDTGHITAAGVHTHTVPGASFGATWTNDSTAGTISDPTGSLNLSFSTGAGGGAIDTEDIDNLHLMETGDYLFPKLSFAHESQVGQSSPTFQVKRFRYAKASSTRTIQLETDHYYCMYLFPVNTSASNPYSGQWLISCNTEGTTVMEIESSSCLTSAGVTVPSNSTSISFTQANNYAIRVFLLDFS